jgi:hypothetical protein
MTQADRATEERALSLEMILLGTSSTDARAKLLY